MLERSLTNVLDLAAQLSDDHLIIFNAGRAIELVTRGVHIFDQLKTPKVSLLLAWRAKVQTAAAVPCAREVLNKCA